MSTAAGAVILALAPAAFAQSSADRATARELGEDGERALTAKDYKRAEDDFRRADTLVHAPTLMLGLARALAGEGKLVDAQEAYKSIIREGVAPGAPKVFQNALEAAKSEVQDIAPRLGGITVTVKAAGGGDVPNVHVTVDGSAISGAAIGVKRVADPGVHVVNASADGFKPASLSVTVPVGGSVDAPLTLTKDESAAGASGGGAAAPAGPESQPASASPAGEQATPETTPATGAHHASLLPWIAFGVGGAGLVTGIITGAMAMSKRSDIVPHCSNAVCPPDQQSAVDTYNTLGLVSTVGFVVAGVGAAAGVVLLITQPKADEPAATSGLHVVPVIGPGSFGAKGSF